MSYHFNVNKKYDVFFPQFCCMKLVQKECSCSSPKKVCKKFYHHVVTTVSYEKSREIKMGRCRAAALISWPRSGLNLE